MLVVNKPIKRQYLGALIGLLLEYFLGQKNTDGTSNMWS